uniref:Protein Wnt n=1 Tax=Soboliphyme baturini TaxID=241478 RepID=A0A183J720_9BILA
LLEAVKKNVVKQCKCHGVSGSCTTRTCWEAIPNFRVIGNDLREKYDHALHVIVNPDGAALMPAEERRFDSVSGWRKPYKRQAVNKVELVYFEPSPDYCDNDIRTGSLGTAGRQCNLTSSGPDSCDVMCCGRGYDTVSYMRTFKCHVSTFLLSTFTVTHLDVSAS